MLNSGKFKGSCSICKTPLFFKTQTYSYLVCPQCRFLAQVSHSGINTLTQSFEILEDMSPIQIGTRGKIENKEFEITGRINYILKNGYRNLWVLTFNDDTHFWMGESYGHYVIYKSIATIHLVNNYKVGKGIKLPNGITYTLNSIDNELRTSMEGEIPSLLTEKPCFTCLELSGINDAAALIQFHVKTQTLALIGQFMPFEYLSFTNLRDLHEWK